MTEPCPPWVPPRLPSHTRLITDALPNFVTQPDARRCGRRVRSAARRCAWPAARSTSDIGPVVDPAGRARHLRDAGGCRDRAVSFAELDLAEVRALKTRFGVDDQRRRARRLLGRAAHAPGRARPGRREPAGGGGAGLGARRRRTSAVLGQPALGHVRPAVQRPADAAGAPAHGDRDQRARARAQERAVGYGPMASLLTEAVPPALAKPMIQLGVRARACCASCGPGNLMISNVPGPDFPLYFAGMQLAAVLPARTGGRRRGAQHHGAELPRLALRRHQRLRRRRCPTCRGLTRAMVEELGPAEPRCGRPDRAGGAAPGAVASPPRRPPADARRPPATPGRCPRRRCRLRRRRASWPDRAAATDRRLTAVRRGGWRRRPCWARVARCSGRTWRGDPVARRALAPQQGAGQRASGRVGSSRSRRTTAPTTPPRTPTGG